MAKVVNKISSKSLPTDYHSLVRLNPLLGIHDEVGYNNAMEFVDALVSIPKLSQGQNEYLDALSILVEAYELVNHPIETDDITPLEMLKHLMEANDMSASDLGRLLGERSLGPKILNGDRDLSKSHIRKLAERFAVSPALFI
jgi:HTH-type transcriptional regulator/antitoxin HigA